MPRYHVTWFERHCLIVEADSPDEAKAKASASRGCIWPKVDTFVAIDNFHTVIEKDSND